jgi:hypothetical protein
VSTSRWRLAALNQLAAIKTTLEPTPLNRLDGLAVQDCGGWLRIAASGQTDLRSQVVVQLLPGAVVTPATEVRPGSAPRDEVTRDHPPLSATSAHVADGIEDRTQVGARPAKRFGRGQERLQVAEVRWVEDTRHALRCLDADCGFLTRPLSSRATAQPPESILRPAHKAWLDCLSALDGQLAGFRLLAPTILKTPFTLRA